ncbi:E3 ubiquitin-protein ligase ZNF598 [Alosa sapidissima]|uniref:E3 ubiquitin-protein ligase ZNF598 n=1 Tax=Alosa sapidissima TaxID=34773 RepID=UPI001C097343|nr:E3 ubiquitin-protein ligase ZNF598 [Alosa sapidissima]
MESTSMKETERTCVLCCQDIEIFALGKCDHPVCYRCSTKMRVLCEQKYCAVCREELDKVIFVKRLQPFSSLSTDQFQCEKKNDIYFNDAKIYAQYRRILLSECPQCQEPKVFSKFEELEQHMRKQHELFCCKICVKHLKIFSYEKKWYNRKDLARHRTQGDPDDTSHRGHPLCKFCDERYLDNDELLKHLRRDHYFCHFCDADGAQEYYSDYQYLMEHFRESHYLCEEGRCSTEQFTHAFRSEIDYKAHKAAAHSKNRAEARQNRQIDLQFSYAPRQQRRNEGMVGGEDYDEVERFNRHGRGGRARAPGTHQNMRKSWRYNREEEERDVAAALQASLAMQEGQAGPGPSRRGQEERGPIRRVQEERGPSRRGQEERGPSRRGQEERGPAAEKGPQKPRERMDPEEMRNARGTAKPPSEAQGRPMGNISLTGDDFPGYPIMSSSIKPAPVTLKEDDFPSLSSALHSAPMTPAYSAPPRSKSSFQEEDFPALISKIKPRKPPESSGSAWAGSKTVVLPTKTPAAPPASAHGSSSGPQPLLPSSSSSSSSSSKRKKKLGTTEAPKPAPKIKSPCSSDEEDPLPGKTVKEIRAVPTMLDISSLLTVKGGPAPQPSTTKAGKKKKPSGPSSSGPPGAPTDLGGMASSAAHKENVPQSKPPDTGVPKASALNPNAPAGMPKSSAMMNGYTERPMKAQSSGYTMAPTEQPPVTKPLPASDSPPLPMEEEFPALISKKPPPGFKGAFPLKSTQTAPPPPPPGLGGVAAMVTKPPPGFTGVPLNSNVVDPPVTAANRPTQSLGTYLKPDNFQKRNMDLIQSIKNYLQNDESKFNEFKNYSGQFRQGVISAAQYHRSCQELLGDNFNRVFNELLVLLPDTQKQQELLTAHGDFKALEKQQGGGAAKAKKNKKKTAWQTSSPSPGSELDCQVCPTCRQVLAPKDFNSHKTLHMGGEEDFPSLQAISKIIS